MIFGDLERLLAQLYPYRLPLVLGGVVAVGLLVIVGRRRGWFGVVRRHRRVSLIVLASGLIVGLPTAWVLGSPLIIRSHVEEARPVAASSASSAPGSTGGETGMSAARTIAEGAFRGADDFHFGSGDVFLLEIGPGRYTLRLEEFSVRNGPDLFVYLSPSATGYADGSLELGPLKASDGSFNYEIPSTADVQTFRSVIIWCRAFGVLFALAPLSAAP